MSEKITKAPPSRHKYTEHVAQRRQSYRPKGRISQSQHNGGSMDTGVAPTATSSVPIPIFLLS